MQPRAIIPRLFLLLTCAVLAVSPSLSIPVVAIDLAPGATPLVAEAPVAPVAAGELSPLSGIVAISSGSSHTCAVTAAGGVKCWGSNWAGQLGDGSRTDRLTPVDVVGLTSGVKDIAAGHDHTCALTTIGTIKCWGDNTSGQLGDGSMTPEPRLAPVQVVGIDAAALGLAAGQVHTCALTGGGSVKCWGANWSGQLGDGTTNDSAVPVEVKGLAVAVKSIAAGAQHTCALTVSGGVKCWGMNESGQLGDGSAIGSHAPVLVPVNVSGLSKDVQAITAKANHTCALTTAGGAKCWGSNDSRQLGDGTTRDRPSPVEVIGLSSGVYAVSAGYDHTCALVESGVKCWGSNSAGRLGDGTILDRLPPVDVIGLVAKITAVSAGGDHTCALTAEGTVQCWGDNPFGALGNGTTIDRPAPAAVTGITDTVQAVAAGYAHTCALTATGRVKCWGWGLNFLSTDGKVTNSWTPIDVNGLNGNVQGISSGGFHTCAVTTAGGVKCWGQNAYSQLGDGTHTDRLVPVDVYGLSSGIQAVSAGGFHTCAVTTAGGVKCWGSNTYGQLGDGTRTSQPTPVDVVGLASGVQSVSAGLEHTCAVTAGGSVKCWGRNGNGQLGDGTRVDSWSPGDVPSLNADIRTVAAGGGHTCALTAHGGVKCWGAYEGSRGSPLTEVIHTTPQDVMSDGSGITAIAAGGHHTCAVTSIGDARCWGNNHFGQLGDGKAWIESSGPVDVIGLGGSMQAISGGDAHSCGLTVAGSVACWGENLFGQRGINPGWTPSCVVVTPLPSNPTLYLPSVGR